MALSSAIRRATRNWWTIWGLAAFAYVFASAMGIALTWDGSFVLFATLQKGEPMIAHGRYSNLPIMHGVLLAREFVDSPMALAAIYGLLCSAIPLISLAVAFLILGKDKAPLRIWPALGILVAALPGQMCLTMEAMPVLQLFWIPVAWIAVGRPWAWTPAVALAAVAMFYFHPAAALLFGALVVVLVVQAALGPRRWQPLVWAVPFGLLAARKAAFTIQNANPYEQSQMSLGSALDQLFTATLMTPFPLAILLIVFAILPFSPWPRRQPPFLIVAIIALTLALYFSTPLHWVGALNFRKFGPFMEAPLALAAVLHAARLQGRGGLLERLIVLPKEALLVRTGNLAGMSFLIALCGGALVWRILLVDFERDLRAAPSPVTNVEDLGYTWVHPLYHWCAGPTSFFIQGRAPARLHLGVNGEIVQRPDGTPAVQFYPGGPVGVFEEGWFDLSGFRKFAEEVDGSASAEVTDENQ